MLLSLALAFGIDSRVRGDALAPLTLGASPAAAYTVGESYGIVVPMTSP
jgi:hypothetical protein